MGEHLCLGLYVCAGEMHDAVFSFCILVWLFADGVAVDLRSRMLAVL